MSAIHQKRLAKELKLLVTQPPPGVRLEEFTDMTKYAKAEAATMCSCDFCNHLLTA